MLTRLYLLLLQVPMGTPKPGDTQPLDLSDPFELIMFVIMPIVILILYFLWKRDKKKHK
jgi:hypothetical protein